MPDINILVRNKVATAGSVEYVCGNSDFTAVFDFDAEWDAYEAKTARFSYNGGYTDVVFTGSQCAIPIINNTYAFHVGVYAGNLHTTTPARVPCKKSILCGSGFQIDPPVNVYNQIMEQLQKAIATNAGISDISKISTVGNVDTYKIALTDGTFYTFTVTNGEGGGDQTEYIEVTAQMTPNETEQRWEYDVTSQKYGDATTYEDVMIKIRELLLAGKNVAAKLTVIDEDNKLDGSYVLPFVKFSSAFHHTLQEQNTTYGAYYYFAGGNLVWCIGVMGGSVQGVNYIEDLAVTKERLMALLYDDSNPESFINLIAAGIMNLPPHNVTGATVGQILKVTEVDTDGKPTAYAPVDMPSGGGGETWKLLQDVMVTADTDKQTAGVTYVIGDAGVQAITFDKDASGAAFAVNELHIFGILQASANSSLGILSSDTAENVAVAAFRNALTTAYAAYQISLVPIGGKWRISEAVKCTQYAGQATPLSPNYMANNQAFGGDMSKLTTTADAVTLSKITIAAISAKTGMSGRLLIYGR